MLSSLVDADVIWHVPGRHAMAGDIHGRDALLAWFGHLRHLQLATAWMEYLFCTPEELESILEPTPWEFTDAYAAEPTDPDGARWPPGQWTAVLKLHG